jgi:glycosyltransferase involved in cell wall biosynthesis
VVVPCLDEEEAIGSLVIRLWHILDRRSDRVLVVDNGSRDRTADVARAAGAEVVCEARRGYGQACRAGLMTAGDGIAVFLDGDGADDPSDLERVVAPIRKGEADLAVGVRRDRETGSMTAFQRLGNRLATTLISRLTGATVSDLGPLRAIRVRDLVALDVQARTYGWSTEMTVKALRAGLRYVEVPVRHHRRLGRSKVSGTIVGSLRAGARILWTAARWAAWRPHPAKA